MQLQLVFKQDDRCIDVQLQLVFKQDDRYK